MDIFVKRLKEARLKAGLSQKALGIKAGMEEAVASPRMNQYETGKHHPDPVTLERICKVLNVPIAYMYCEDDLLAMFIVKFMHLTYEEKMQLWETLNNILPVEFDKTEL